MTDLLFYDDSYLRDFDATIVAVDKKEGRLRVALDRTAFYPGGGGQPNDSGWLTVDGNRFSVDRVKRESGRIWHALGGMKGASVRIASRQRVRCELDWARRYALMRTHTAMHILCGVVWRDYGASVTGGDMKLGAGRMDFEFAAMSGELVAEIERSCNAEIAAARPVITRILPRAEAFEIPDLIRTKINLLPANIREVRTIDIQGLDVQADGGTHVNNTTEVGRIRVVGHESKGRVNKRLRIALED
jgi:misacylated tRNA(Ala) deacylase